tara:strand:- start:95 stop:628 length:534 start_codon:yes stop_codon:yes gene_type:complete
MEDVVLINKNNQPIGTEDKLIAHQKGLLHRAFSIIIYNKDRELLLQRRAEKKYHTPNLWTNTCCSHPFVNESYEDAVHRRLNEEMGIKCKMTESFSFIYKANLANNLIEHEHDTVFIGQSNLIPNINTAEVSDYKYISYSELLNEINLNPTKFTPWFKMIINKLDINFFNFKSYYYA